MHDVWLNIEDFCKYFDEITICHAHTPLNEAIMNGQSNSQFCFDILQESSEIMIDLCQKTYDQIVSLGFEIYKVEINRAYKIHNMNNIPLAFTVESTKVRNVFKRVKLNYGRYILIPIYRHDKELLLRIYSPKNVNLK